MPLTALAAELNRLGHKVLLVADREIAGSNNFDFSRVSAGKFRRYRNQNLLVTVFDIKTHLLNMIDLLKFAAGIIQSYLLIKRFKPDTVFLYGGFTTVPVGLAAGLRKVPYLIHESDSVMGLSNRLLLPRARTVLLGLPPSKELETKLTDKTVKLVGIPLRPGFKRAKPLQVDWQYRRRPVILVAGGSKGANRLNQIIESVLEQITANYNLIWQTGREGENSARKAASKHIGMVHVVGFHSRFERLMSAADLVISRAGATVLAELAALGKPAILIPAKLLPGLHQIENARLFARRGAAEVLDEDKVINEPDLLINTIESMRPKLPNYAKSMLKLSQPDANEKIIGEILNTV